MADRLGVHPHRIWLVVGARTSANAPIPTWAVCWRLTEADALEVAINLTTELEIFRRQHLTARPGLLMLPQRDRWRARLEAAIAALTDPTIRRFYRNAEDEAGHSITIEYGAVPCDEAPSIEWMFSASGKPIGEVRGSARSGFCKVDCGDRAFHACGEPLPCVYHSCKACDGLSNENERASKCGRCAGTGREPGS